MLTILNVAVIVFFLLMGLVALASPNTIGATNGWHDLTPEGRNEIRAVYGGFGVAVAGVLAWAMSDPTLRPGVFLAVAASLAGMAFGRLIATAVERPRQLYPSWFYFGLEAAMAASLAAAAVVPA